MIGYEELQEIVPSSTPEERDAFFTDNDIAVDDVIKLAGQFSAAWMEDIPEGAMITAHDIDLAMKSLFLLGFETAWRLKGET